MNETNAKARNHTIGKRSGQKSSEGSKNPSQEKLDMARNSKQQQQQQKQNPHGHRISKGLQNGLCLQNSLLDLSLSVGSSKPCLPNWQIMSNSKRIKSSQGSQAQHPSQTQLFSLESRSATLKFFLILTGKFTVGLYEDFYISQATVTLLLEPDTKPKYCMTCARAAMLPKNREHDLTVVSKTVMGQKNLSHPMSSPRITYAVPYPLSDLPAQLLYQGTIFAVSVFPAPLSPEIMKDWFLCSRTWPNEFIVSFKGLSTSQRSGPQWTQSIITDHNWQVFTSPRYKSSISSIRNGKGDVVATHQYAFHDNWHTDFHCTTWEHENGKCLYKNGDVFAQNS